MNNWKKEMIAIIMDSDRSIEETIVALMDESYKDELNYYNDVQMDEIADQLIQYDKDKARELLEVLKLDKTIDIKGDE